ncbi:glycosyl hydrolase family 2, partial [bacterium]|nr:glycosyl hydrolase family 2 [bacterium]
SVSVATGKLPIRVRPWSEKVFENVIPISNPKFWSFQKPNLYKVEVILENESEEFIDDYVVTSGFRTISQQGGTFRINGKPEMLNGSQIMGFRMPLDKIATWNRCVPKEWLVKELLMIKNMNANLLRVHVHAWQVPARNINDPRIAEIADQLGIMLIWGTTGWIRSGQAWGVDFEGYPKYMKQVYNHPSIVMWEASNHPTRFKDYDFSESNLFYEKVYNTIYPVDKSRLISGTSHIRHTHYGNDLGTIDYKGNPAEPCPAWTAPMVTRGNQDAVTGYGKNWTVLRKWPNPYTKDFIDSKERAYFNFEHEESTGQPNWTLVKGKPWYHLQSYEWGYDEGSIGRKLTVNEWQESQGWQAFSAYESMRKQRILDYDGFSWCCLHGGANTATYKKPLIDCCDCAKLAFYTNKMIFQRVLAGSNNVDVVYGPDDVISPVIINLGDAKTVELTILVRKTNKEVVDKKTYSNVNLSEGRTVTSLPDFNPAFPSKGYYAIEYIIK